jgi:hypothetical protein
MAESQKKDETIIKKPEPDKAIKETILKENNHKPKIKSKPLITDISKQGGFLRKLRGMIKFDKKDMKTVGMVVFNGIIINFSLYCIFAIPINFYSWLGWGLGYHYLENRIPKIVRRLLGRE